jgi:small conductance mechanosensitive channel
VKLHARIIRLPLFLIAIAALPVSAQEQPPAPAPVTTSDPSIKVDHLTLRLDPLTKSELAIEAEAWRGLVKENIQSLAEANIELSQTKDTNDSTALNEKLAKLQETKTALLKRFDTVLTEFEDKGGDAAELRTYASAVSGIKVADDAQGAKISAMRGWLTSEEGGVKFLKNLIKFAAIVAVFWILASIASRLVKRITDNHLDWSELLERFINKLVKRAIIAVGVIIALSSVGFNVGALLALIGGGAFIIGFALQDTLGNFAAGLMLLVYRPFDVGDFVETAGVMGTVDNVSLVSTTIRTPDNKVVLVPNKNVWGQVITNATASAQRRVDMVFGIGYGDDMAKAQEILERILAGHDKVLQDPAPVIKVNELADSSVNFVCRPWSATPDYWDVFWDVTRKVKEEFDANNISIPFPQQDVHMHQVPTANA